MFSNNNHIDKLAKQLEQWFRADNIAQIHYYLLDLILINAGNENITTNKVWTKIRRLLTSNDEVNQKLGLELVGSQYTTRLKNDLTRILKTLHYKNYLQLIDQIEISFMLHLRIEEEQVKTQNNLKKIEAALEKMKQDRADPALIRKYETGLKDAQDELKTLESEYYLEEDMLTLANKILEISNMIKNQTN